MQPLAVGTEAGDVAIASPASSLFGGRFVTIGKENGAGNHPPLARRIVPDQRTNFLYLTRLGSSASGPSRRFLSSLLATLLPSNHYTWS